MYRTIFFYLYLLLFDQLFLTYDFEKLSEPLKTWNKFEEGPKPLYRNSKLVIKFYVIFDFVKVFVEIR